jgi:hypothetical protein
LGCYVSRLTVFPAAILFLEHLQVTQTASLFENMRVVTSVPGLVSSSQKSFPEVTIVVRVLFSFCANLPHSEFNFILDNVRCPTFLKIEALSKAIPSARR